MAEATAAPTSDWDSECLTSLQPLPLPPPPAANEAHLQTAAISLWTVVAAVQSLERKVEVHGRRLLHLEGRTGTAEKKLASCEKTATELGNQPVLSQASVSGSRERPRLPDASAPAVAGRAGRLVPGSSPA